MNISFSMKLDCINYLVWKQQVLYLIIAYGLVTIIDPHVLPLTHVMDSQTNPKFTHWNRLNNIFKSWFYLLVTPSMHPYFKYETSTTDLWCSLEKVHSTSSHAFVIEPRLQSQTMSKNDLSVKDYVMLIRSLVDHLTAIGEAIIDHDLIIYAISGLDSNYKPFVSFFTMRFMCFSFDEFHSQILTYERHIE